MSETKLISAQKNREYRLKRIDNLNRETLQYLKDLGFIEGEMVELMFSNYKKGSYLVKVMGISYMLDKVICENITVEDE